MATGPENRRDRDESERNESRRAERRTPTRWGEIEVNIPGVEPDTPVSDLTVAQFVDLVAQVLPQISRTRRRPLDSDELDRVIRGRSRDSDELDHVIRRIRSLILERAGGDDRREGGRSREASDVVRDFQLELLDRMPELMRRICR